VSRLAQFALSLLSVVLGLVLTVYVYALISDPVTHEDILERALMQNICLAELMETDTFTAAAAAECATNGDH
jgi:hypothetical protein